MRNNDPTHTAPYYGGEKFARTLQQAFGPYAELQPTQERRIDRWAPWIVLALGLTGIVVSYLDFIGVFA